MSHVYDAPKREPTAYEKSVYAGNPYKPGYRQGPDLNEVEDNSKTVRHYRSIPYWWKLDWNAIHANERNAAQKQAEGTISYRLNKVWQKNFGTRDGGKRTFMSWLTSEVPEWLANNAEFLTNAAIAVTVASNSGGSWKQVAGEALQSLGYLYPSVRPLLRTLRVGRAAHRLWETRRWGNRPWLRRVQKQRLKQLGKTIFINYAHNFRRWGSRRSFYS